MNGCKIVMLCFYGPASKLGPRLSCDTIYRAAKQRVPEETGWALWTDLVNKPELANVSGEVDNAAAGHLRERARA